jgi:Coenzyme PQQ synthesis protein D (PqqD)
MSPDHSFECNAPDVVFENFGDEAVILNLQSGNYYSLDGIGMVYWEYLSQGVPHREIVDHFTTRYAATVDQTAAIAGDFDLLLDRLQAEGLVRSANVSRALSEVTCTAKASAEYTRPELARFDDVADMLLLDPVHDVSEEGWPNPAPAPGREPQ